MSSDDVEIIGDNEEIIEISDDNEVEDSKDVIVINFVEEDTSAEDKSNICIVIKDEQEEIPVIIPSNSENAVANLKDPGAEVVNLDYCSTESANNNKIRQKRKNKRKRRCQGPGENSNKTTHIAEGGIQECNKVLKSSFTTENTNNILNTSMQEKNSEVCNNKGLNNITQNEKEPTNYSISSIASSTTAIRQKRSNNYDFSKLKWLKPLKNISSPPHLQIVIIDRSHPNWRITNDKWLMLEKRLLEALNCEMLRTNDSSIGLFDGAKWMRGIKIVGCHNKNAFNFITKFILNLDKLWHGAKLDVFPITQISRHTVKVYIPPPTLETQVMLSLMRLQNASLCCEDWEVLRERERGNDGGVDIWFSINDESFTDLCRLRGEIKYGINRIFFKPSD
ncbi:uncharacterized protein LOC119608016 [Lucilia sericata]|uniref:uncharacterized protein LOC119608016 n=1 Tax=Lucilia sericata TaxID=13632 RepID=UPI0018A88173|nr:uncharacterized protein LOC119608016 [Lucilia sericata]